MNYIQRIDNKRIQLSKTLNQEWNKRKESPSKWTLKVQTCFRFQQDSNVLPLPELNWFPPNSLHKKPLSNFTFSNIPCFKQLAQYEFSHGVWEKVKVEGIPSVKQHALDQRHHIASRVMSRTNYCNVDDLQKWKQIEQIWVTWIICIDV